ncbi:hypothetical protein JCM10213_003003 [Rhodosporidiobolus nylandii]
MKVVIMADAGADYHVFLRSLNTCRRDEDGQRKTYGAAKAFIKEAVKEAWQEQDNMFRQAFGDQVEIRRYQDHAEWRSSSKTSTLEKRMLGTIRQHPVVVTKLLEREHIPDKVRRHWEGRLKGRDDKSYDWHHSDFDFPHFDEPLPGLVTAPHEAEPAMYQQAVKIKAKYGPNVVVIAYGSDTDLINYLSGGSPFAGLLSPTRRSKGQRGPQSSSFRYLAQGVLAAPPFLSQEHKSGGKNPFTAIWPYKTVLASSTAIVVGIGNDYSPGLFHCGPTTAAKASLFVEFCHRDFEFMSSTEATQEVKDVFAKELENVVKKCFWKEGERNDVFRQRQQGRLELLTYDYVRAAVRTMMGATDVALVEKKDVEDAFARRWVQDAEARQREHGHDGSLKLYIPGFQKRDQRADYAPPMETDAPKLEMRPGYTSTSTTASSSSKITTQRVQQLKTWTAERAELEQKQRSLAEALTRELDKDPADTSEGQREIVRQQGEVEAALRAVDAEIHRVRDTGSHGARIDFVADVREYRHEGDVFEAVAAAALAFKTAAEHDPPPPPPERKPRAAVPTLAALRAAAASAAKGLIPNLEEADGDIDDGDVDDGGSAETIRPQRRGAKHRMAQATVRVPADEAYRTLAGPDPAQEDPRLREAARNAFEIPLAYLGQLAQFASPILDRLRHGAATIYPLHPLLTELQDPPRFAVLVHHMQELTELLASGGVRPVAGAGGRLSQRLAEQRAKADAAREKKQQQDLAGAWFGVPSFDIQTPPAGADVTAFLEAVAECKADGMLDHIWRKEIPLLVYQHVKRAFVDTSMRFSRQVPQAMFRSSLRAVGTGHCSSASRNSPSIIYQLADALGRNLVATTASFTALAGAPFPVDPSHIEMPPGRPRQIIVNALTSPSGGQTRSSLATRLRRMLLRMPVSQEAVTAAIAVAHLASAAPSSKRKGKQPAQAATRGWANEVVDEIILALRKSHRTTQTGALINAAKYVYEHLAKVQNVVHHAFATYAKKNGHTIASTDGINLEHWFSDAKCPATVLQLAQFQESWLLAMDKPRSMRFRGRSLNVDTSNIGPLLQHSVTLASTVVDNYQRQIVQLNDVLEQFDRKEVLKNVLGLDLDNTKRHKKRKGKGKETRIRLNDVHTLPFVQIEQGGVVVPHISLKPAARDGAQELYRLLQGRAGSLIGGSPGWWHSASAIFTTLFRCPDAANRIVSAHLTVSRTSVNFLLLDPTQFSGLDTASLGITNDVDLMNHCINDTHTDSTSSSAIGNFCHLLHPVAARRFARQPLYETRKGTGVSKIDPVFQPENAADPNSRLVWRHAQDRPARPLKGGKPPAHVRTTGFESFWPTGKAHAERVRARLASMIKSRPPPVAKGASLLESLDGLEQALIGAVDKGEHYSFAMSLRRIKGNIKDDISSSAILLRTEQLDRQEKRFKAETTQNEASSTTRRLLALLKTKKLPDLPADAPAAAQARRARTLQHQRGNVAFLEQLWANDSRRHRLQLQHALRFEAGYKMISREIKEYIVSLSGEAAGQDAQRHEQDLIIFLGAGLDKRRSKGATGSDKRHIPTKYLLQALAASPRLNVLVVNMNEMYTSQTCPDPVCRAKTAQQKKVLAMDYGRWIDSDDPYYRLLVCPYCGAVFDRDVSAGSCIGQVGAFNLLTGQHLFAEHTEKLLGFAPRPGRAKAAQKKRTRDAVEAPVPGAGEPRPKRATAGPSKRQASRAKDIPPGTDEEPASGDEAGEDADRGIARSVLESRSSAQSPPLPASRPKRRSTVPVAYAEPSITSSQSSSSLSSLTPSVAGSPSPTRASMDAPQTSSQAPQPPRTPAAAVVKGTTSMTPHASASTPTWHAVSPFTAPFLRGLVNPKGVICFANAVLQAISRVEILSGWVKVVAEAGKDGSAGQASLTPAAGLIVDFMRSNFEEPAPAMSSTESSASALPFLKKLRHVLSNSSILAIALDSAIKGDEQQDAHEVLAGLLDLVFSEAEHTSPQTASDAPHRVQVCMSSTRANSEISTKIEDYNTLPLPIHGNNIGSVGAALDEFTTPEVLEDGGPVLSRRASIASLPQLLILQLGLFTYEQATEQSDKIVKKIAHEGNVEIKPEWMVPALQAMEGNRAARYAVRAVIYHTGESLSSGHYVCLIRSHTDACLWTLCDDSTVELQTTTSALEVPALPSRLDDESLMPYILFYDRLSAAPAPPAEEDDYAMEEAEEMEQDDGTWDAE